MLKAVSFILLLSSVATADYAGFASGSTFQATPIEGNVLMTCDGFNGTSQANYTCRDVVLEPQNSDIFVGPLDNRATQVELKAVREDNSSRVKINNYDGRSGKSSTFNLWISSLFQKPLLMAGVNHVHYSIYTNSPSFQEFASGDFDVMVNRAATRVCPTTQYHSTDVTDCNSQYSICQRYFEQYNNCR
ncbi:MAG TPA: hypothetical protein VF412_10630 [Bdellovibrio sp.]|uniref:hypothetical protein n=1 Tax=Bdellovibrio sp. TaxID=28201 RepID=UPI002F11FCC1